MPDDTDTSEDISASPAPQDGGANVGSVDSEISSALTEAGADFSAPEAVDGRLTTDPSPEASVLRPRRTRRRTKRDDKKLSRE